MAIISMTWVQLNTKLGSNLLAIHNPLVFIVNCQFSGAAPDFIYCKVSDSGGELGIYKAIPYRDPDSTNRQFMFIADTVLRSYMPSLDYVFNSNNITAKVSITKKFTLRFYDVNDTRAASYSFLAVHATRQFSDDPCLIGEYSNFQFGESQGLIIGIENFPTDVYFYNVFNDYTIAQINIAPGSTPINDTGESFYRKTFTNLAAGEVVTTYTYNGTQQATKTITVKPRPCGDFKVLKYLNRNGQYCIYPFEKYVQITNAPEKIGTTNELFASILTDTNSRNVGYKNTREMVLNAYNVPKAEIELLSDLTNSPRVYLYVGVAPSNTASDWVLIEDIKSSDNIVRHAKKEFSDISFTITLPEWFNITML